MISSSEQPATGTRGPATRDATPRVIYVVLLLALLVVGSRWPFRTQHLFNWDAANFALGMRAFDVTQHQPHPPGYPYFVGLGALLSQVTGDANAALITASIFLEVVAVAATYLFGRLLFSAKAGQVAAVLLAGSVTFWSYGEVALAYPALATFSVLTAYYAYQAAVLGRDRLLMCAAVYGLGSGFRPDLALFLFPLLLVACYRKPPRQIFVALIMGLGGVVLWLAPTALLSGGFDHYWEALSAYAGTDVIERYAPIARGFWGLVVNGRDTGQYLFFALYAEAALVLSGLGLLLWQRPREVERIKHLFLLGWMAPMVIFYLFVHIGDPGYVFSFLPALLLLGVGGWYRYLQGRSEHLQALAASGLALVLLANTLIFFMHQRPLTLWGLRTNDVGIAAKVDYIRTYQPPDVLLVSYDSFKHFRYYLPEYTNSVWLDTSTGKRQVFPVPRGVRWAILTDPSVFIMVQSLPAEAEYLPGETWAAKLSIKAGQSLVYEARRLRLEP